MINPGESWGVPQEKWTVMRDAVLECLGLKLGENGVFFVSLGGDEHSMRSLFLSPLPATWKKPLKPQCGRMAGQIFWRVVFLQGLA